MSDSDKINNPVPRVVKGTGFYTPMDLAPGEAPAAGTPPQALPPSHETLTIGLPTTTNITPADTGTQEPSTQSGNSSNAQGNSK